MKKIISLLLLLTASWITLADSTHFSVQVAATKNPDLARFREVTEFGSLYTEETGEGLIRVKVGSYASRAEAEQALSGVQARGFTGAFITSATGQSASLPDNTTPSSETITHEVASNEILPEPEENQVTPEQLPAWSRLTEDQKRDVVYLDGVLHLRRNGEFIPLSRY